MEIQNPLINLTAFTALGIDIGGTKIAAGVVTFPDGRVLLRRQIATQPARGGNAVLDDVFQLANELATEAGRQHFHVNAIGCGVCELVNTTGDIFSGSTLPWQNADVREGLAIIAPTVIEADVRAAAMAEAMFGAGKSQRIFVYVTVGTGISSCLVIEGNPFVGARGATGTLAGSLLPHLGPPWNSCAAATLEQIAAGPALVAHFNQAHGQAKTAQEVVAAALAGNAGALSVVRSAGEALGATVAWLVNVLDPESVIIGGGLGLSEGVYWDSMVASARQTIWSDIHRDLPIVRAATGVDAGLIGAAAAAWKKFS